MTSNFPDDTNAGEDPNGSDTGSQHSALLPESQFRKKPRREDGSDRIIASRWIVPTVERPLELVADAKDLDDSHIITCILEPTESDLFSYGRGVFAGYVSDHNVLITGPKQPLRTIQRKPFNGYRLYLPQSVFRDCYEAAHQRLPSSEIVTTDALMMQDTIIRNLMHMVYDTDQQGGAFVPSFIDGIGLAIVARLLQLDTKRTNTFEPRKQTLAKWRLARVLEYINANLHRPIYLIEMANAAGLSRMRFATQFRAATGFSPHEYILRQKVNRARDLLRDPSVTLVDVALQLGFRSQSHFSTVFKKQVGDSPARWRTLILNRSSMYCNKSL